MKYCLQVVLFTSVVMLGLMLASCDGIIEPGGPPPPENESQTDIIDVLVEPNPVTVGDTAIFTCIIEDSLDESFEFRWTLNLAPDKTTPTNQVVWVAPDKAGTYSHRVTADNGDENARAPNKGFAIIVTASDSTR